ncbi:uncharacterized protein LOC115223421 isoform X2 [Octopus sinensis]|uniref:Uncharacterized protein LOC115223421 isoform X2 n=1 Tax=Octopus sinensis TaxID=2607531 RepID=A0A7E6FMX4_9MOLL|nr:uncharacterized protein LOC115223421 isoform X2 [Octopus sinensis]
MNTYYISNTERSNFRKVELTLPTRIYGSNNQGQSLKTWGKGQVNYLVHNALLTLIFSTPKGYLKQTSKEEKWVDYISLLRFPVYLPAQDVLIEFQMEEGSANGMTFISNLTGKCFYDYEPCCHQP